MRINLTKVLTGTITFVSSAALTTGFLAGCATTKYVNQKFDEAQRTGQENSSRLTSLQDRLSSAELRAQQAFELAGQAKTEAEKAKIMAAAFADYQEIGNKEIHFAFDRYTLSDIGKNVLDEIGKMMQDRKDLVLEIAGHTDQIGPDQYNMILGQNRALAVEQYLNDRYQIPLYRMYIISYGKAKPKTVGEGRSGSANRRVELRLLGAPGL